MISRNLFHFNKAFHQQDVEENRRGGRFPTSCVESTLGRVIDLSHCGAMVLKRRFRKLPDTEEFVIRLRYAEFEVLVDARIVRQSKQKGVGLLLGLEFINVTDEQREAIKEIIRDSRSWEALPLSGSAKQSAA